MDVKNVPVHSYEVNIFSNMISTQPDWYSPRNDAGAFTHVPSLRILDRASVLRDNLHT